MIKLHKNTEGVLLDEAPPQYFYAINIEKHFYPKRKRFCHFTLKALTK